MIPNSVYQIYAVKTKPGGFKFWLRTFFRMRNKYPIHCYECQSALHEHDIQYICLKKNKRVLEGHGCAEGERERGI